MDNVSKNPAIKKLVGEYWIHGLLPEDRLIDKIEQISIAETPCQEAIVRIHENRPLPLMAQEIGNAKIS